MSEREHTGILSADLIIDDLYDRLARAEADADRLAAAVIERDLARATDLAEAILAAHDERRAT